MVKNKDFATFSLCASLLFPIFSTGCGVFHGKHNDGVDMGVSFRLVPVYEYKLVAQLTESLLKTNAEKGWELVPGAYAGNPDIKLFTHEGHHTYVLFRKIVSFRRVFLLTDSDKNSD